MLANGLEFCSCPKIKCERHGSCEACISHHKANKKFDPYCMLSSRKRDKKAPTDPKKE